MERDWECAGVSDWRKDTSEEKTIWVKVWIISKRRFVIYSIIKSNEIKNFWQDKFREIIDISDFKYSFLSRRNKNMYNLTDDMKIIEYENTLRSYQIKNNKIREDWSRLMIFLNQMKKSKCKIDGSIGFRCYDSQYMTMHFWFLM